jgi:hypothetical protein
MSILELLTYNSINQFIIAFIIGAAIVMMIYEIDR